MKFKSLSLAFTTALLVALPSLASAQEVHSKSFFKKLEEGGWVMIPLAICSIAMLWLLVDGILRTRPLRLVPPMELEKLRNAFRAGDYVGAYQVTQEVPCAINNVVRAGLVSLGDGKDATEEAMLAEINKEQARGAVRLSYLSVLGVCTPMIGLIGTVTGMIRAFEALGQGNVAQNADQLASAIGEVLVATATGLFIAVPAFMAYYFLRNRLQNAMQEVEYEAMNLFRKLPYHLAEGVHIGDQELYANTPNWVDAPGGETAAPAA
ncbi:MAG: MotA/TolQ/ExbB proton channel family protein [Verrucomicrobiales bacterium]|nr:MotA/TolQ/ExbB proton channel family protein [Verrucomicrobiales bacterium]